MNAGEENLSLRFQTICLSELFIEKLRGPVVPLGVVIQIFIKPAVPVGYTHHKGAGGNHVFDIARHYDQALSYELKPNNIKEKTASWTKPLNGSSGAPFQ